MTVLEILSQVDTPHAVITGGEPTMYDLDSLIYPLQKQGIYVQLETSGQNNLKGKVKPDWITISPKHNLSFSFPEPLALIASEIKWVVDEELPLDTVIRRWEWYKNMNMVPPWFYFMPEGCPSRKEMFDRANEWLMFFPWEMQNRCRITDRLQYRMEVR